jgi:hypothetical protein
MASRSTVKENKQYSTTQQSPRSNGLFPVIQTSGRRENASTSKPRDMGPEAISGVMKAAVGLSDATEFVIRRSSTRTEKIHVPYTISEDASCDQKSKILSRISDKRHDSHGIRSRRGSRAGRRGLKHGHGGFSFLCTYEDCERGVPGHGFPRHVDLRDHIKRVHNEPGGEQESDTSASSELTTPPVVMRQPQEPSLIDRYHVQYKRFSNLVPQLQDPRNVDNMALLRSVSDCIKLMAQTTQRISASPLAK